ncbi:MAG TPA: hypothetical protein VK993_02350 [Chthoniobacterales bacterium]|nr:hypothetical protein [Chthoniobacterales bacterium]
MITLEPEQLQRAFDAWARVNQDFLDGSTDHFGQFLVKLNAVRRPFGATLAAALQRAYAEAPPRAALLIRDRDAHVVASLCRALQREAGSEPFFLVSRRCGELIGRAHTLVAQWLRMFQSLHIIELVEKGYQGRGARYFYIADD